VKQGIVRVPDEAVTDIAAIGRFVAQRGWVPATSGNFSLRLDADTIVITRSGRDKSALGPDDLIAVTLGDDLPVDVSAEAPLHVARYRTDAKIGAIVHTHSVAATVLSRMEADRGELTLEGFEMHKSLQGFTTHESTVRLPIFANVQDTDELAQRIERRLGHDTEVPGYLLAGHGLYAWGARAADARRHVEGLEFLLACNLEERKLRR
jgi:methylthioribulose-1-phosphate dehydratase